MKARTQVTKATRLCDSGRRARWCDALLALTLLVIPACDRPAERPPSSIAATTSSTAPASAQTASRVPDRVLVPNVDLGEAGAGPARIVSLAPSATEFCCALGLRERIVGRTRYCDYPPGVEAIVDLGTAHDLSAERLLTLHPDLILVTGTTRGHTDRLAGLGLAWRTLPDGSLADIYRSIDALGEWTSRPRTATALAAAIREDVEQVAARHRGGPRRRVLLVVSVLSDPPAPPTVAGPGSFYDELMRMAGIINAAPEDGRDFGPLSLEAILTADPEFIIELDPDGAARPAGEADARVAWGRIGPLRAVREGRVRVLVGNQHYVPGPRIAQTFDAICRALDR
ncbi:MAG: helical backbone metal receptor [Phycisphaerae bacterium]|nr:helical backbone metal receptor [Phycisphaerae bacterium]